MLKPKLSPEQGFTLIEVLAAILIMTLFIATTMQMLAIAAVFKFRAKQAGEATALIQQDIETVKSKAITLKNATLGVNAVPGDSAITVVSTNSSLTANSIFAVGDKLRVGMDMFGYTITSFNGNIINITPNLKITNVTNVSTTTVASISTIPVDSVSGFSVGDSVKIGSLSTIYTITAINNPSPPTLLNPKSITVNTVVAVILPQSTQIVLVQPAGSIVSAINNCPILTYQPARNNGFGSLLNLPARVDTPIGNYIITRTAQVKNAAPFETVELNYMVKPATGGNNGTKEIVKLNAEVIVDAALKCP